MRRAVYNKQFKMEAVKMVQAAKRSVLDITKELGVSASSLRRWIDEHDKYGESAFPGYGNALFNSTYEIKKLQNTKNLTFWLLRLFASPEKQCCHEFAECHLEYRP